MTAIVTIYLSIIGRIGLFVVRKEVIHKYMGEIYVMINIISYEYIPVIFYLLIVSMYAFVEAYMSVSRKI